MSSINDSNLEQEYKIDIRSFSQLSIEMLYSILQLRSMVFVVEQNCPYLDMDDKDQLADHVMIYQNGRLAAYSRIFFPGVIKEEAVIGRVLSHPQERGTGIGKRLMEESIAYIYNTHAETNIYLSAQEYLKKFYGDLGFVQSGPGYLEDDIPHIPMIKEKNG